MSYRRSLVIATSCVLVGTALASTNQAADARPDANVVAPTVTEEPCGGGISAVTIKPSSHFNALTATPAQLDANGYPSKPVGGKSYKLWKHFVTNPIKRTSSCSELAPASPIENPDVNHNNLSTKRHATSASNAAATLKYANWAGYIVTGGHKYTHTYAQWNVPKAQSEAPSPGLNYSVDWVGLNTGNSASAPLIQAGTESDADQSSGRVYRFWYEVYPVLSKQNLVTSVTPGDTVQVGVFSSGAKGASFRLDNLTVGYSEVYNYSHAVPTSVPQAEWIHERPTENGGLPYLADANVSFTSPQATYHDSGNLYVSDFPYDLPHTQVNMYSCDNKVELADTGVLSDPQHYGTFQVTWKNSGGGMESMTPLAAERYFRRFLYSTIATACCLALLGTVGCGASSTGAPPLTVCGTTLWSGAAGATITDATTSTTSISSVSAGGLVFLRLIKGCDHGVSVSIEPVAAARVTKKALATDHKVAGIAIHPLRARFTVETHTASQSRLIRISLD